jgi:hypothetical protein
MPVSPYVFQSVNVRDGTLRYHCAAMPLWFTARHATEAVVEERS